MTCPICLHPNCAQDGSPPPQGCGVDLSRVATEIVESARMRAVLVNQQLPQLALVRRDLERGLKRIVASMLFFEAAQLTGAAPVPAALQPLLVPVKPPPVTDIDSPEHAE